MRKKTKGKGGGSGLNPDCESHVNKRETVPERELSEQQQAAIMIMASRSGQSIQSVADAIGLDRSTVSKWKRDPLFAEALEEARRAPRPIMRASDMLAMLDDEQREELRNMLGGG